MQTGFGRFEPRAQLFVFLLRCQQLLAQGNVVVSQRLTTFSDLADFGFEGIEFSVHELDYSTRKGYAGGFPAAKQRPFRRERCAGGQSPLQCVLTAVFLDRAANGYNSRLQVPMRLSAA